MHIATLFFALFAPAVSLQESSGLQGSTGYTLPPQAMVDLLDAAPTPGVRTSPDSKWMLLVERPAMPPLAEVVRPWVGLAGVRIDPACNAPKRDAFDTGLTLRKVSDGSSRPVVLPQGARIDGVSWSHTSEHFVFALRGQSQVDLWAASVANLEPKRIATGINTVLLSWTWASDGQHVICPLVPQDRPAAPPADKLPDGPAIQETSGEISPTRTYQDLLGDETDARSFEHFATSQLASIHVGTGATKQLGKPALYVEVDSSPSGQYLLVGRLERPFSYLLPASLFPSRYEVWDQQGALVHTAAVMPLGENIPIEGVRTGPRQLRWQASAPATLAWFEALDGGDPKRKAPHRDRVLVHAAPFQEAPRELLKLEHRARGLTWLADPSQVIASEYDRDRRWVRTRLFSTSGAFEPKMLDDRSMNDRYADKGGLVQEWRADGSIVPRQDGDYVYRAGQGASPAGARPFLDRQNLATLEIQRLWQCQEGRYEVCQDVMASGENQKPTILVQSESNDQPPRWIELDLQQNATREVLAFPDPQPALRGIQKRLVKYKRADGVDLSATLYLPKDYVEGTRLPLVVWAYPMEYSDPLTAGQVTASPHRFMRVGGPSHLFFLLAGYAIMDDAAMPIVGDPETMNETFLDQAVASAKAAIEEADRLGVGDPTRVGVGGHSYGAFMTANLLAHCDLFRAGIARSGAYNRTLTPFGFQSERRTLWEAPATYTRLSPFFFADRINEPLLMIHGERDSNPGTFPMQSERLFQAMKGHGGKARLVVLPGEDHGYRARESVMHCLAEMIVWFDGHVKNVPSAVPAAYEKVPKPEPAAPVSPGRF